MSFFPSAKRRLARQESTNIKTLSNIWRTASRWSHVIKLNRDFLEGKAPQTCYHGQLDPETELLVPSLNYLHKLGILTTGSQPFLHDITLQSTVFREARQRAALDFWVPTDSRYIRPQILNAFLNSLRKNPEIIFLEFTDLSFSTSCCRPRHAISKYREAQSQEELEQAHYVECTHSGGKYRGFSDILVDGTPAKAFHAAKPLYCEVVSRAWGNVDVLGMVKQAAKEAGLDTRRNSLRRWLRTATG